MLEVADSAGPKHHSALHLRHIGSLEMCPAVEFCSLQLQATVADADPVYGDGLDPDIRPPEVDKRDRDVPGTVVVVWSLIAVDRFLR